MAVLLPPPNTPLLFSLPVIGDVQPAANSSGSKDGASLPPPPPTAITTDPVSAGLAQTALDTATPETLQLPSVAVKDQPLNNKELAFAIRLIAKDSPTSAPAPENSGTPGSALTTSGQSATEAAPFTTAREETATPVSVPDTSPRVLTDSQPVTRPGARSAVLNTTPTKSTEPQRPAAGSPVIQKDLPSTTPPAGRNSGTAQQPNPIEPPKIAPARQAAKGTAVSNNLAAEPAIAQRSAVTDTTVNSVRDIAPPVNTEFHPPAQPKPLDTRIEAAAPVLKAEPVPTAPVSEISVRFNGPDQSSAAIRVLDRSGEIRVAVHTSDPQLANTLRTDVDQLRSHMTSKGWDADVWTPQTASVSATRESGSQGNSGPQDQSGSGGRRDWQGQNQPRQNPEETGKQPAWMEEFEATVLKGGQ